MLIVPRVADSSWLPDLATGPPEVLVIDRQPLFLAAIGSLLGSPPLNAQVRTVTRTDAALESLTRFPADVVLCEARAQPQSGPELASTLVERTLPIPVILLADEEDSEILLAAFQCGATGFFTKGCPSGEFLAGVEAVLAGHFVVARSLAPRALGSVTVQVMPNAPHPLGSLSASERGILAMIGRAQSIASIAAERGITRKTVRNHLSHVYRKLGVRNRAQAILCAARLGLVDTDPGVATER